MQTLHAKIVPKPDISSIQGLSQIALGSTRKDDGTVEFLVWAPQAETVDVRVVHPSEALVPLSRGTRGYFHGIAEVQADACRYFYRLNGATDRPDPASRLQSEGVHGPSSVVPREFHWTDSDWSGLNQEDYIFYELHVGTYSEEGTFDAVISRLAELKDLGITAVEVMPVAEFPGNRNWGYDGVYPFAAHAGYGGPVGLKRLVNECHRAGLAAVLDVVYNHLGPEGNYLAEFGPYFTDRYHTPWGKAVNFDGPGSDEVVRYFVANALQWLDEFHFDALRLDAIHGIIDRNAQPFLALLAEAVKDLATKRGRKIHLIAESDANDARFVKPPAAGGIGLDAHWSDDFHHSLHAIQTGEHDGYYSDFGRLDQLAKAFRRGFVYDGQYSKYRKRRQGNSPDGLFGKQFVVCSQNHDQVGNRMLGQRMGSLLSEEAQKLSAVAVVLSPFLPLLFMGEEHGETAPFLYFTSHGDAKLAEAVRQGRREEFAAFAWQGEPPDPQSESTFQASKVNHAAARKEPHRKLRAFYKELIRLRKSIPALRNPDKDCVETMVSGNLLLVRRWHDVDEVLMFLNFGESPAKIPAESIIGGWKKLIDSSDGVWGGPGNNVPDILTSQNLASCAIAPKSACVVQRAQTL